MEFIIPEIAVEIELILNITNSINLVDYSEVKNKHKKNLGFMKKGRK